MTLLGLILALTVTVACIAGVIVCAAMLSVLASDYLHLWPRRRKPGGP